MDLAHIGFKATTTDLDKADKKLDKLGKTGENTDKKIDKSMKGAVKSFKSAGKAAKNMGVSVGTAAVTITAGMAAITSSFRDTSIISQMSNQTIASIDRMAFAYKQFGLDIEQVNDIYKDSSERVGEWINEQSGELSVFGAAMGMTKQQITEFAKEVENLNGQQLLQRMVDDMEKAGIHGSRMSNVLESMASDATKMIPALTNSGTALSDFEGKFKTATEGMELSGGEADSLTKLATSFDLAVATVAKALTKLAAGAPATFMDDLVNRFTDGVTEISKRLRVLGVSFATFDFTTSIREEHTKLVREMDSIKDDLARYDGVDVDKLMGINVGAGNRSKAEFLTLTKNLSDAKAKVKELNDSVIAEQKAANLEFDFLQLPEFKGKAAKTSAPVITATSAAYKDQVSALTLLNNQLGKSSSELFVMSQAQKSIARNDAPELTAAIRAQATAYADARDKMDVGLVSQAANDAWLQSIIDQTGLISKLEVEIARVQDAVSSGLLGADAGTEWIEHLESKI